MHCRRNRLKTAVLIGLLSAIILLVGSSFGSEGLQIAVILSFGLGAWAYFNSHLLALRAMRARPLGEFEAPMLHWIVRELSNKARQPMPRLYLSPTEAPNAFATGRDPRTAVICCTDGLLRQLNERELRAVLAHELAHIRYRDTLLSSVAAALAAFVIFLANLAWLVSVDRDDAGDGEDGDAPGAMGGLLLMVLGPLAAVLIQMAVSRSREYRADAFAVRLTGDPAALASALRKLDAGSHDLPLPPEPRLKVAGHLMIVDPFHSDGPLDRIFSTHPSVADRIARLERLAP
ncbi:M48 family metalloprotease [Allostreptomyces psammosilenae]|uniref:Protease HtpX homolog n=1 Tax=Allostreptomyces psammosilenae TaxID=1892865 RepID=A0A852ZVA9_9ACTN|nr:M48 family metalloprotease [Allostreptomyces psammosilenae]NYI05865.1 heat shock protein HtpX [Allostreptomyces psammosilenae]